MDFYQKFIQEKAEKKRKLMGTMFFPRTPVAVIDMTNSKRRQTGSQVLFDLLEGLDAIGLTTLVVVPEGKDTFHSGQYLRYLQFHEREMAYGAADFAVMLSNNVSDVWSKGCVPISKRRDEETKDYNPLQEKGNGFYFENANKWEIFAALVRGLETYQFPYDWENLIREIMRK